MIRIGNEYLWSKPYTPAIPKAEKSGEGFAELLDKEMEKYARYNESCTSTAQDRSGITR